MSDKRTIDQKTVDEIYEKAQIKDVVGDFVNLRHSGVNLKGLCPFHHEKTPSFLVSPSKNIFKCFGCGKGGNPVNFLMELEHYSYVEALEYLAKKYNITIEEKEISPEDIERNNLIESLRIVNEFATNYFENNLKENEEGIAIGLSYFKERGFNDHIIKEFKLGYSLQKKDAFSKEALKKGYKLEYLIRTGLTIGEEKNNFDRFFGRVMFPIFSLSGKILGFGGRVLQKNENTAKYLNSPESEIYNKSKTLYGLFQAKSEIIKKGECLLVEGYTDVLSMHMSGLKNTVASSGTSLTEEQAQLIKRFTNNVTILYDGDAAGIKAAKRGIDILLKENLDVRIVLFPDNHDPDSFVRLYNGEKTIEYIENNRKDFIKFKTELDYEQTRNDPMKRATLIAEMANTIAIIEDDLKRSVYINECAKIFQVAEASVLNKVMEFRNAAFSEKQKLYKGETIQYQNTTIKPPTQEKTFDLPFETVELDILRFFVDNFDYINDDKYYIAALDDGNTKIIFNTIKYFFWELEEYVFKNNGLKLIYEEIKKLTNAEIPLNHNLFINNANPEISKLFVEKLFGYQEELSKMWEINNNVDISNYLRKRSLELVVKYKITHLKNKKNNLMQEIIKDSNNAALIATKIKEIDEEVNELAKQQNIAIV